MSRPSLASVLPGGAVLLVSATGPAMLRAQTPAAAVVHAPSAVSVTSGSQDAPQTSGVATVNASSSAAGPRPSAVAFRTAVPSPSDAALFQNDANVGAGRNLALLGVGAAAVAIGLLVGGTAGTGIAVGGGLVGLYGLYLFLE